MTIQSPMAGNGDASSMFDDVLQLLEFNNSSSTAPQVGPDGEQCPSSQVSSSLHNSLSPKASRTSKFERSNRRTRHRTTSPEMVQQHGNNADQYPLFDGFAYGNAITSPRAYEATDDSHSEYEHVTSPIGKVTRGRRAGQKKLSKTENVLMAKSTRVSKPRPRKDSNVELQAMFDKLSVPLSILTERDPVSRIVPVKDMVAYVNRSLGKRLAYQRQHNGNPGRPMNVFMLYRSAYADRVKALQATGNHQNVSRMAGWSWKNETLDIKQFYQDLALLETLNHKKHFPNYKFQPVQKHSKKGKSKGAVDDEEDFPDEDDFEDESGYASDPDAEYAPAVQTKSSGKRVTRHSKQSSRPPAYRDSPMAPPETFRSYPQQLQQQQQHELMCQSSIDNCYPSPQNMHNFNCGHIFGYPQQQQQVSHMQSPRMIPFGGMYPNFVQGGQYPFSNTTDARYHQQGHVFDNSGYRSQMMSPDQFQQQSYSQQSFSMGHVDPVYSSPSFSQPVDSYDNKLATSTIDDVADHLDMVDFEPSMPQMSDFDGGNGNIDPSLVMAIISPEEDEVHSAGWEPYLTDGLE